MNPGSAAAAASVTASSKLLCAVLLRQRASVVLHVATMDDHGRITSASIRLDSAKQVEAVSGHASQL